MASGDTDERKMCTSKKNPHMLLKNLKNLMEHPISKNATERQLHMLHEFLDNSHYAFWLQDIPQIIHLYEMIVSKLEIIKVFVSPLKRLFLLSAVPPMMTRTSEIIDCFRDLQEYFSVLGYLILCVNDTGLKKMVLESIKALLRPEQPVGYCCVPLKYCHQAAEKSNLPAVLGQLLQVMEDELYILLLDVMFITCQISVEACQKILKEDAVEFLLQRLEPAWKSRPPHTKPNVPTSKDNIPYFEDTCCVLWKLLNVIDRRKVQVKDLSICALWGLQYAFRWIMCFPEQKFNRNNLAAIVLKILVTFPNVNFAEDDFSDDIEIFATTAAGCRCHLHIQYTEDMLDFQFKKIIWACLHFYRCHKDNNPESDILRVFLDILSSNHSASKDHTEQYCELIKIILKVIPKFFYDPCEEFLNLNGPIKVVNVIKGYLEKSYDIEVLEAYMYCLNEMLRTGLEDFITIVGEYNTADIVISVCRTIYKVETLSSIYQKILAHGFCVLQILCKSGYLDNLEIITVCMDYLQRVSGTNKNDPLIDVRVTICATHLLWECVRDKLVYREFLTKGGIYTLLDITEASPFSVKTLSLGILADVASKPSSVPFFTTWRKRGKNILPVLLEIFRNKEDCSKQVTYPNEEKNVWEELCQCKKNRFPKECISDLTKKCRFRIHAILLSLKVKNREITKITNDHYKIFSEDLDMIDELTMKFAHNFLSLILCQSWLTIKKELKEEGVTPVDDDRTQLNQTIRDIRQWQSYLQEQIQNIIQQDKISKIYEEKKFYLSLKEARLSDALDALKELQFISICTEPMFLSTRKFTLRAEVEPMTSEHYVTPAHFHRTISPFTNVYNQTINIESNIMYEKKTDTGSSLPSSSDDEQLLNVNDSEHDLEAPFLEC